MIDFKSILIGVVCVVLALVIFNSPDESVIQEKPKPIDNTPKIEAIEEVIEEIEKEVDDSTHIRIDSILKAKYEGVEECIDTVVVDGVTEYVWNGCR